MLQIPIARCTLPLTTLGSVKRKTRNWLSASRLPLNGSPSAMPWGLRKSLSDCKEVFEVCLCNKESIAILRTYDGEEVIVRECGVIHGYEC